MLCLLPRLIAKHLRQTYYPTDIDVLRVVDKFDPKHDYVHDPSMPAMRARSAYADGTPGGADMARISSRSSLPGHEGFPMQALQPTASRASSTHYDMLTGTERPNRGFTFSAEDYEPRRQKRKLTVKGLIPGTLKRSMRKREERRLATQAEAEREEDDNTEARISGPEVGQYGS